MLLSAAGAGAGPHRDALRAALRDHSATMSQSLHALSAFASEADIVKDALERVVQLDQTDDDSALIARGPGRPAILAVMQAHVNDTTVREMCCRCIANMSLLTESDTTTRADAAQHENKSTGGDAVADKLVEANAVELVLGTMAAASRLSAKGQCWAATALLNLVMKSEDGAGRAAKQNAEETLATLIERVILDATPLLSVIALDAALGSLCRIGSTSLPDNDKRLVFRFQVTSFAVVEAIVSSMIFLSQEGIDGERTSDTEEDHLSRLKRAAVHKAWEALRQISSHHPNLPIVYDVISSSKAAPTLVSQCVASWRRGQADDDIAHKSFDASVETMTQLTARRHDLDGRADATAGEATTILPTDEAQYVVSTICDGQLASLALEMLRPSLENFSFVGDADRSGKLLSLLLNLSEHDPVVSKSECLLMLRGAIERLIEAGLPNDFRAAIVGRCLSCVWNIANSKEGAESCKAMEIPQAVDSLVSAIQAYQKRKLLDEANVLQAPSSESVSNKKPKASGIEQLGHVAEKLQGKLQALITSPVYAHTKFEKPK